MPSTKLPELTETLRAKNHSLNILLAEDNIVNQRLAVHLLEKAGHNVTVAGNGNQAVDAVDSGRFDLVLMDVQMPELNGLDATRAIRTKEARTGGHIPIIAMTAHAMKGDRDTCISSGMDGYLCKPIRAVELFEVIENNTADYRLQSSRVSLVKHVPSPDGLPFDPAAVLARVNGDQSIVIELVEAFLGEYAGLLSAVRKAILHRDAAEVIQAAHALKGSVCNLTDKGAFEAAAELETLGRVGDLRLGDQVLQKLELEMGRLVAALLTYQSSNRQKAFGAAH
jgi:CheY-like chemotaxis protein